MSNSNYLHLIYLLLQLDMELDFYYNPSNPQNRLIYYQIYLTTLTKSKLLMVF